MNDTPLAYKNLKIAYDALAAENARLKNTLNSICSLGLEKGKALDRISALLTIAVRSGLDNNNVLLAIETAKAALTGKEE